MHEYETELEIVFRRLKTLFSLLPWIPTSDTPRPYNRKRSGSDQRLAEIQALVALEDFENSQATHGRFNPSALYV